jgi:HK97 family phage prohead protease
MSSFTHHHGVPFSVKECQESGEFWGYASVFHVEDHHHDSVSENAFEVSLKAWKQRGEFPKMLWQHDPTQLIGRWLDLQVDGYGLKAYGLIVKELALGLEVHTLLRHGLITDLSIGYHVQKTHWDPQSGKRRLDEVDLMEISLVTFGANPHAKIVNVKQKPDLWFKKIEELIEKLTLY